MDKSFEKDSEGSWVAPLPFRSPRPRLPNNKLQAIKRARMLDLSLQKNPSKKEHFVKFMQQVLDRKHAEVAPSLADNEECWYLPLFGVYHPKKPHQIRGVFDSSAQFAGISLNNVLLTGPDMTNNLLGILIRFRKYPVAITADIEHMFYCFVVREDHRNYLRFLWYRDNDPSKELIEYRMCVHAFGNSPSPAVATYGLRLTALDNEHIFGTDVREFIERNFYVDDGLVSLPTAEEAISLLKRTQELLKTKGCMRLHKIASNKAEITDAFPQDDLAKDLKDINLSIDEPPLQRSLGLLWDLKSDSFTFQVSSDQKPYTRRGILSTINSLFDPIGIVAPVLIQGKLILRELMSGTTDWDEPLPPNREQEWSNWRNSLNELEHLRIPRTYLSMLLDNGVRREIHVFSDASEKAIATVAYLKVIGSNGEIGVGFILGKMKVAPTHGHTVPRLELCAAVLAVGIAETISDHIDMHIDMMRFYTDSRVVLGYIHNQTKRFYMYVSNRVELIRNVSTPEQWTYIATNLNPADCGTRCLPAGKLEDSSWITGPAFLYKDNDLPEESFSLVNPDGDRELRSCVQVCKSKVQTFSETSSLGSHRFERFSSWKILVRSIARLQLVAKNRTGQSCVSLTPENIQTAEKFIVIQIQREKYYRELACIERNQPFPHDSPILKLNPVLDRDGLLRVGGRINASDLCEKEKNPLILPGDHHIALLLVRHYHNEVKHQGRHLTEGAVRTAGYWILGGKSIKRCRTSHLTV